jgi:hypothetical protein
MISVEEKRLQWRIRGQRSRNNRKSDLARRLKFNKYHKEYRAKNKDKIDSRKKLFVAVRAKKLIPMGCLLCGKKAQAHHDDYTKPLEVVWLCPLHHKEHERKNLSTP